MPQPRQRIGLVRRLTAFVLAACVYPLAQTRAEHPAPEVWLAPLQPAERKDGTKAGAIDYFALFQPNAPWQATARHVSVFKVYPELLRSASDEELRAMLADLRSRHIRLGLETKILTQTGWCGPDADHKPWMVGLVQRLKQLGAELDSVSMVGPLVDGHVSANAGWCHRPISEVAADAARTVALMRGIYPGLTVGEIEPVGGGPGFPTAAELRQWFTAFQQASGTPVAFLHVDTVWGTAWRDDMRAIARQARTAGVRFGVIYKADPTELSDAAFAGAALANADAAEAVLEGPPDQVIIQSWEDFPRHALPDSDPSSLTGIARAYLRPHTALGLAGPGRVRLASSDGAPIAGATLRVAVLGPEAQPALVGQELAGMVPHGAASALLALRIHTECTCSPGPVSLMLSGFQFRQPGVADVIGSLPGWGRAGVAADGSPAIRVDAAPGQRLVLNGPRFPVTADRPFVAKFRWQVPASGGDTGFMSVIFQSAAGQEIRRTVYPLRPSWQVVGSLTTGIDGMASSPPRRQPGASVRLEYQGDIAHRPALLPLGTGESLAAGPRQP